MTSSLAKGSAHKASVISQNNIMRQSIAPGHAHGFSDELQAQVALQKKGNEMIKAKSMVPNDTDIPNPDLVDTNQINLRMSEHVDEDNVNENLDLVTKLVVHQPQVNKEEVENPITVCYTHKQDFILFCLKCQEKICTKCLDTTHLLHPVVPLNSVNKLDFKRSLQKEIEKSLNDIKLRDSVVQNKIG